MCCSEAAAQLILWLLICTMMCPVEANCECPKYLHHGLPVGTVLRVSLSPLPESKCVMLKCKVANEDALLTHPEDATPPMKKLALAS